MALTDNVVSYWKADESSWTLVSDVLWNNNWTASTSALVWWTWKINNWLDFTWWNHLVSAGVTWMDNGDKTIAMRIYPTNNSWTSVISQPFNIFSTRSTGWFITIAYSHDHTNSSFRNAWAISNTSNTYFPLQLTSNPTWWSRHFICYTQSWTTAKAYYNGSNETTDTLSWTIDSPNWTRIWCGIVSGSNGNYFDGNIDEIWYRDRALSDSEILELYNSWAWLQYPFGEVNTTNFFMFV